MEEREREREQIAVPPGGQPEEAQPAWRRDFPVDWPEVWIGIENHIRRLRGKPERKRIATLGELPVGGAITFRYLRDEGPAILLRPDEHLLVAYSQKCTHLACAVVPRFEAGALHCPCHEGYFDLRSGSALAGPPRRPLPRIRLEVRGGEIYAVGVELRTT